MRNIWGVILFGVIAGYCTIIFFAPTVFFFFGVILLFMGALYLSEKRGIIFILLTSFLFGFFHMGFAKNSVQSNQLKGRVVGTGVVERLTNSGLILTKVHVDDKSYGKVVLYTERRPKIGQEISFRGLAKDPEIRRNPGGFSGEELDLGQGISFRLEASDLEPTGREDLFLTFRGKTLRKIGKVFDENLIKDHADLMKAIILGESLTGNQEEGFRDLGIVHLLSISGFHMALIYSFLEKILGVSPLGYRSKRMVIHLISMVFLFVVGMPVGALRCWGMLLFGDLTEFVGERRDPIVGLSFLALLFFIYRPFYLYHMGFLLSYLSVLGLFTIGDRLGKFFDGRIPLGRSIGASLGVVITTFPILVSFGGMHLLIILANVLLVPIYSLALLLGFFMIMISLFSGKFLFLIGFSLEGILTFGDLIMGTFLKIPVKIFLPDFSLGAAFLYYFVLVFWQERLYLQFTYTQGKMLMVSALSSLVIMFGIGLTSRPDFRITMLYVGQGDGILLEKPGYMALIDTGGSRIGEVSPGEKYTLDYLYHRGISKLDHVFLSHYDADHCEGLLPISKEISIGEIRVNHGAEGNEFYEAIKETGIPIRISRKYSEKIDDMELRYLQAGPESKEENENSMVLLLEEGDFSMLFTGDLPKEREPKIAEQLGQIDVLKVGHHGSKTSTSAEFLENIRPKIALISAGVDNAYGHPHDEVLDRLVSAGAKIYSTAEDGAITLEKQGGKVKIRKYLPRKKENMDNLIMGLVFAMGFVIIFSRGLEGRQDDPTGILWKH